MSDREVEQTARRVVREYDAAVRRSTGRTAKHKGHLLELVREALTFEGPRQAPTPTEARKE